jgi:hypothetical protein
MSRRQELADASDSKVREWRLHPWRDLVRTLAEGAALFVRLSNVFGGDEVDAMVNCCVGDSWC